MTRVSFLLSAHCHKKRTTMINNAGNGKRSIERGRMRRRVERLGFGKRWVFLFSEEEMAGRKSWRSMGDREKKAEREREELSGLWTVGSIVLLEICGGRVLKFERPFSGNGQDLEIFLFFWMVH